MGWFIRKAFTFGPFRLNVSKSGLGTSTGVTGLRVGTRADDQDYVFGGRNGLYFRENLGREPALDITPGVTLNHQAGFRPPDAASGSDISTWSQYADAFVTWARLTIDRLVEPLTVASSMLNATLTGPPPRDSLNNVAMGVSWKFAIGPPVTEELAIFLSRMGDAFLKPDANSEIERNLSVARLRRLYENILGRPDAARLLTTDAAMEGMQNPLQLYDHAHGSAYAQQAKTLWLAIAGAVLRSTGGPRPEDVPRLAQFSADLEAIALPPLLVSHFDEVRRVASGDTPDGAADGQVAPIEQLAAGSRLQQAKDMLDKGFISTEDYETVKRRVLSDI